MTSLPTPALQRDTAAPTTGADPLGALWSDLVARRGHANTPHRSHPSTTQTAVMAALARRGGESWCGQLAADTGRDPGNLARFTLPGLHRLGLVERGGHVQLLGGGRPAHLWHITRAGRDVAALLPHAQDVAA